MPFGWMPAVHTKSGRVWHRPIRRDYMITTTKCSAYLFTSRCTETVLVMVPIEKRCARCWGRYTPYDTDDHTSNPLAPSLTTRQDHTMTNDQTTPAKRIQDAYTEADFTELMDRCQAAARANGSVFFLHEEELRMGDRHHAAYLQRLARAVHMDELADRLDPDQFAPGMFENLLHSGRQHFVAPITIEHPSS